MTEFKGRCPCGAVRWRYDGEPIVNLVCHCESCQRATSSAFAAFPGCVPEQVTWEGEITHYQSSPEAKRGFCPTCGARLYFKSDNWPGEIHIHASTFEDPAQYEPTRHCVHEERVPWLEALQTIPVSASFSRPKSTGDSNP